MCIIAYCLCKGASCKDERSGSTFKVPSTFDFFGIWSGNCSSDIEGAYSLVPQTSSNFGPFMAVAQNL